MGEIKPQNEEDFDMVYYKLIKFGNGMFITPIKISSLFDHFNNLLHNSKQEFLLLEMLYDYNDPDIQMKIDFDKHLGRDRYPYILPLKKS